MTSPTLSPKDSQMEEDSRKNSLDDRLSCSPSPTPQPISTQPNKPDAEPIALLPLNKATLETFNTLSNLASKETWENKSRFPSSLKGPLFKCAKVALDTRESGYLIEDNFFAHLQNILPYNKFTLKKLVYKNILPQWSTELELQRDIMISTLKERIRIDGENCGLALKQNEKKNDKSNTNTTFVWTRRLRLLLWELMERYHEIATVLNELKFVDKATYTNELQSDEDTNQNGCEKVYSCFPEGWITLDEIKIQYIKLRDKITVAIPDSPGLNEEENKSTTMDKAAPARAISVNQSVLSSASPTLSPISSTTPTSRDDQPRFPNDHDIAIPRTNNKVYSSQ
ncbi:hypothetical protein BGZ76_001511, partial [Entomortierella beljakovae]